MFWKQIGMTLVWYTAFVFVLTSLDVTPESWSVRYWFYVIGLAALSSLLANVSLNVTRQGKADE